MRPPALSVSSLLTSILILCLSAPLLLIADHATAQPLVSITDAKVDADFDFYPDNEGLALRIRGVMSSPPIQGYYDNQYWWLFQVQDAPGGPGIRDAWPVIDDPSYDPTLLPLFRILMALFSYLFISTGSLPWDGLSF